MLPANAIVYGNKGKLLRFDTAEHPDAVQIGGSDPEILSKAAKICEEFGYDEINLNVGCPSPKVKKGRFGACLMFEPSLVKDCLQAMIKATKIPRHAIEDTKVIELNASCKTFRCNPIGK